MHTLRYFDRSVQPHGVGYRLKDDALPRDADGNAKEFHISLYRDHGMAISQSENVLLTHEVWQEAFGIADDYREAFGLDA